MTAECLLHWFPLGVLALGTLLGVVRAGSLRARRIPVIAVGGQRSAGDLAVDLLLAVELFLWLASLIAVTIGNDPALRPSVLRAILIAPLPVKVLGATLALAGLTIYGLALRQLGMSWRIGIDRATPGPLVTDGVYALTRHPIYVAFDLLFLGTFFVLRQSAFLILAALLLPLLHLLTRREERFLRQRFGTQYQQYCARVGRYLGRGGASS